MLNLKYGYLPHPWVAPLEIGDVVKVEEQMLFDENIGISGEAMKIINFVRWVGTVIKITDDATFPFLVQFSANLNQVTQANFTRGELKFLAKEMNDVYA